MSRTYMNNFSVKRPVDNFSPYSKGKSKENCHILKQFLMLPGLQYVPLISLITQITCLEMKRKNI